MKPAEPIKDTHRSTDVRLLVEFCDYEWWKSSSTGRRCLFPPGQIPRSKSEWFEERADGTEPLVGDFEAIISRYPHFSTDETACFKWIVPAMRKKGFRLELREMMDKYDCVFTCGWGVNGRAKTAAQAVCNATIAYLDATHREALSPTSPTAGALANDRTEEIKPWATN